MLSLTSQDFAVIGLLAFLEGILSIDNALVLALLAKRLPKHQQKKALTYGLAGAVVFRLIALSLTTFLMRWTWVKWVGGFYLLYVGLKHFWDNRRSKKEAELVNPRPQKRAGFWKTVLIIELTDIAFAVDSILAAVALSNKFWVVFIGGFLGIVLMRFAANSFIVLLERFPRMEVTAYLLVTLIGSKLLVDASKLPGVDFHSVSNPATWVFWGLMAAFIAVGATGARQKNKKSKPSSSN
ncbi:MAG: TerC family protein [Bdellovibrionales bacterium]|nr:TerC family protein [Bdellovibrionales bacterium]